MIFAKHTIGVICRRSTLFLFYHSVSARPGRKSRRRIETNTCMQVIWPSDSSLSLTTAVCLPEGPRRIWQQDCKCRLPGPLTPAKRAREAQLGGASQAGSSLASPSQRLKTEPTSGASTAAATGAAAAAGSMPGDDLPPVIAPPGRSALALRLL